VKWVYQRVLMVEGAESSEEVPLGSSHREGGGEHL